MALHVERTAETVNRTASGREGMKFREIEAKYPPEKAKKLASLLRSRGMWHWDPDFPNDEEERGWVLGLKICVKYIQMDVCKCKCIYLSFIHLLIFRCIYVSVNSNLSTYLSTYLSINLFNLSMYLPL